MYRLYSFCRERRVSIIAFLSLTAILVHPPAQAATVNSTADDGPGSLREAIANATPGEIIGFAVNGVITLTSGELLINQDLTILGPGADTLVIQRSLAPNTPDFRIVNVEVGTVTISGLTLKNGRSDYGGGILNQYGELLVTWGHPERQPGHQCRRRPLQ